MSFWTPHPTEPRAPAGAGAIIVAAGQSERFGGGDKLFVTLGARPLLLHTLLPFQACPAVAEIALVLNESNLPLGQRLVQEYGLSKVSAFPLGGARRQDSVRHGLAALGPWPWVIVHDGARPLVTEELIHRGLETAQHGETAVAAVPLMDTVKEVSAQGLIRATLDRGRLWAAQTPQVFRRTLLERAFATEPGEVPDEAMLLEQLGYPVRVFPGAPQNLKITTPQDLKLAESLLALREREGIRSLEVTVP